MDPKVQWTEIALTELHDVAEYIARDSGARAAELISEARASAQSIATLPEASPMVQEFDDPTIRETYVKRRYRLIYQLVGSRIRIIAICRHSGTGTNAMRQLTIEQFEQDPRSVVEESQRERIVLTQDGTPVAVVVGLKNRDAEDAALEASPEFWRMIEARRRATRPMAEAKAGLFADP